MSDIPTERDLDQLKHERTALLTANRDLRKENRATLRDLLRLRRLVSLYKKRAIEITSLQKDRPKLSDSGDADDPPNPSDIIESLNNLSNEIQEAQGSIDRIEICEFADDGQDE
jgi:hypothetical protein